MKYKMQNFGHFQRKAIKAELLSRVGMHVINPVRERQKSIMQARMLSRLKREVLKEVKAQRKSASKESRK